jgi:tight adherence protein C
VALVFRDRLQNPMLRLIFPVASGGIGYLLPAFVLGRLVSRRHEKIRLSLPDVLDLLVISTEAGCGLDQSIVNVSRELKKVHPAVSEELSLVNMEIMAGKSRAEAMRNFARRTGEEEVKKLVAILIQTDRFGTSVADALRTQSEFLRIRRRQEAEERAGKVGVKLVFPIFFFCLPSLLVVTAGPGILQLFHNLFPALKGIAQ